MHDLIDEQERKENQITCVYAAKNLAQFINEPDYGAEAREHFWIKLKSYIHPLGWLYHLEGLIDSKSKKDNKIHQMLWEERAKEEEKYQKSLKDVGLSGYKEETAFSIARRAGEYLCFRLNWHLTEVKSGMGKHGYSFNVINNGSFLIASDKFNGYLATAISHGIMCTDSSVNNPDFRQQARSWLKQEIANRTSLEHEIKL